MVAIHQVLPVFAPRDAIGNHTVEIRRALHARGITSEIIAGEINPGAAQGARTVREIGRRRLPGDGPTWLLYHASTGSPVAEWFAERPEGKLIDYHNISPPDVFGAWEPHVGVELEHGRRQLAELADITDWALADSTFNQRELNGLGYRRTAVVPILIDTAAFGHDVDAKTVTRLRRAKQTDGGADWLFVSRILPHKAHHDVIKAFAAYRRAYDPSARLHLIGAVGSARYADALTDFVDDLDLSDSVVLAGSVSAGDLEAYFQVADVYVSLSDHEGFAVPLLEAMAHDLPVVAYSCAAVPETAGTGALLLDDKPPTVVAAAVHRVLTDERLRRALVASGREQLSAFALPRSVARLSAVIDDIIASFDGGASK